MFLAPKNRHHQHPHQRTTPGRRSTSAEEEMTSLSHGQVHNSTQHSDGSNDAKKDQTYVTTTWFLRVCKILNILTGMAAILGIITNLAILPIPSPPPDVALRLYGIVLCTLSLITEFEWPRLFAWFGVLETWIGRGLNNIFCAVLILVFDDTTAVTRGESEGDAAKTWILRQLSGYFLLTMGCIYCLGGLACLNRVKERHLSKLRRRDQALAQRQELETRKHEIELLLKDTESQLEKI